MSLYKSLPTPKTLKIQTGLAIASFAIGVILASICLFFIEPLGEIHTSAISIVSELFILAGAMLGINVGFDVKLAKFQADVERDIINREQGKDEESPDE